VVVQALAPPQVKLPVLLAADAAELEVERVLLLAEVADEVEEEEPPVVVVEAVAVLRRLQLGQLFAEPMVGRTSPATIWRRPRRTSIRAVV